MLKSDVATYIKSFFEIKSTSTFFSTADSTYCDPWVGQHQWEILISNFQTTFQGFWHLQQAETKTEKNKANKKWIKMDRERKGFI